MTSEVSNSQDVIDSRDVIARIEELESKEEAEKEALAALEEAKEDGDEETIEEAQEEYDDAQDDFDDDERAELKALRELQEEAEGYSNGEWPHGATLVRETYFEEYCRQMLDDIGDLPKDLPAYIVIDWEATADNIRADYTEVDFDGVAYLIR